MGNAQNTKMNPAVRLIATVITGLIITTIAIVIGMVILGVPGHAASMGGTGSVIVSSHGGGHGHSH